MSKVQLSCSLCRSTDRVWLSVQSFLCQKCWLDWRRGKILGINARHWIRRHHTLEIVAVTPHDASRWLEYNARNRPPNPELVKDFQEQMLNGKWELRPYTPIALSYREPRRLLDGQHRLLAICESGCTVRNWVFTVDWDDWVAPVCA